MAKRPDKKQVEAWKRGVVIEDGYKTRLVDIFYNESQGKGAWVRIIMQEGRKRQIRETCKQLATHSDYRTCPYWDVAIGQPQSAAMTLSDNRRSHGFKKT